MHPKVFEKTDFFQVWILTELLKYMSVKEHEVISVFKLNLPLHCNKY